MSILDKSNREHIASLIPTDIPDWKKSWQEGYEIGKSIEPIITPFQKKHGIKSEVEFRNRQRKEGKLTWKINLGLATVEDQVEALKKAQKFNEDYDMHISCSHQLPKNVCGIPKDKREGIPEGLQFYLDEFEDWERITTASEVQPTFGDQHLGEPNSVFMTQGALRAGSSYQGMFCHYTWTIPGCPDDVWNINEVVKGTGMCAAHKDRPVIVDSDVDDAHPAYCSDLASTIAYSLLEKYIVEDLMGANYATSFGNYNRNLVNRSALWGAAAELIGTEEKPGIGFIYANTIDHWDHHLQANHGIQVPEGMWSYLTERHYRTGATFLLVTIKEKVAIPTADDMIESQSALERSEIMARDIEPLIDWGPIDELKDKCIELGKQMFQNILDGYAEAGVDITNPIELMVVTKRLNPIVWEKLFHPSTVQEGNSNVVPLMPADLWVAGRNEADRIINTWKDNKEALDKIKKLRVAVCSADIHYFGLYAIVEALRTLGADVVDGGTGNEAIDALDIADEHGVDTILLSLHNGQAKEYSELITKLAGERNKEYNFYAGGVLTSLLGDDKEPSDVTGLMEDMGIHTTKNIDDLISQLIANN